MANYEEEQTMQQIYMDEVLSELENEKRDCGTLDTSIFQSLGKMKKSMI